MTAVLQTEGYVRNKQQKKTSLSLIILFFRDKNSTQNFFSFLKFFIFKKVNFLQILVKVLSSPLRGEDKTEFCQSSKPKLKLKVICVL